MGDLNIVVPIDEYRVHAGVVNGEPHFLAREAFDALGWGTSDAGDFLIGLGELERLVQGFGSTPTDVTTFERLRAAVEPKGGKSA